MAYPPLERRLAGTLGWAASRPIADGEPDGVRVGVVPNAIMLDIDEALRLHLGL